MPDTAIKDFDAEGHAQELIEQLDPILEPRPVGQSLSQSDLYNACDLRVDVTASRGNFERDFAKSELKSTLDLLFEADKPVNKFDLDEHYFALSGLRDALVEQPNALSDDTKNLILEIADLVRLQTQSVSERKAIFEKYVPKTEDIGEFWQTRDKSRDVSPLAFFERVYAEFIGRGITRGDLRHLDPKLYTALANWSRKAGNEIPKEVLPSSYTSWKDQDVTEDDLEKFRKINALRQGGKIKQNLS